MQGNLFHLCEKKKRTEKDFAASDYFTAERSVV